MRILLIPIEKTDAEVRTGDWHAAIYHLLSKEHEVVGVVRPRWHSLKGKSKNLILAWFWLKALMFGLFDGFGLYSEHYDVIYAMNTPSATVGLVISILRRKPLIWDVGNPALFNPGRLQGLMFFLERLIEKRAKGIRMISHPYAAEYWSRGFGLPKTLLIPHYIGDSLTRLDFDECDIEKEIEEIISDVSDNIKERVMKKVARKAKMVIIPHLVNLAHIDSALAEAKRKEPQWRPTIMFMGQGNTPSNVQAISWIDNVLAPVANADYVVTGGQPIEGCIYIHFAGYVPNIYEYIKHSDLAVVPIWRNSGAPVPTTRVVDFMACSKAVVLTPFLHDEIPELEDGVNCYIARNPMEFIAKVQHALENVGERHIIGNNARRLIEEKYTWDIAEQKLKILLG